MIQTFLTRILIFSLFLTSAQAVEKFQLKIPKTVSVFNHKITSVSKPIVTEKVKDKTKIKVLYIARWGVHRFEYGLIEYTCKAAFCSQASEPTALAFFERCDGLTKSGKPQCHGLIEVSPRASETDLVSSAKETQIECELNSWLCQRSNDVDGLDEPIPADGDPLF